MDLSATRSGNEVSLTWTMPKRNTDRLPLKGDVKVHVCRQQIGQGGSSTLCEPAGQLELAPASDGVFTDKLPDTLITGTPRNLTYFVELKNHRGRSAGLSNPATVLAGEAPPLVIGLAAEVRKDGVVLRWDAADAGASVRLQRKLLTPVTAKRKEGPLPVTPTAIEQNLLVDAAPGATPSRAIDKSIALGNTYEYRAQRVVRDMVDGKTIELDGEISAPIRVEALDVFPPAVPVGLAAVATAADPGSGTAAAIDLSWQPDTEPDLAGYVVYRREDQGSWQRISDEQPVVGPSFHDDRVLSGHTYYYGVSAIDKGGHESGRSAEASDTVPNP